MQDGQLSFYKQPAPIPEYKPLDFSPAYTEATAPFSTFNDNPALYENASIAFQSGFTNKLNTFKQAWQDTKIGINSVDLMTALVKKANVSRALNQVEADFALRAIDEVTYLTKKNELLDELSNAYSDIEESQSDVMKHESRKNANPVSKDFQRKTQLTMLRGYDASLSDRMSYVFPSIAGSSFSTMAASIGAGFLGKLVKNAVVRGAASAATGAAAGTVVPGAGNVIGGITGFVAGVATVFGTNLFARHLESKAEVGNQFNQDYESLKESFLESKPTGYQISEDEENDLILKAAAGADDMYWKNMSLVVSDTIQSMLFVGAFGKSYNAVRNMNKSTRLLSRAGEFYVNKKLEGFEEGLQYAFQTRKSLESKGVEDTLNFVDGLFRDYRDVASSMNFFGSTGGGAYSKDKEFHANVSAGELLGGLFSGTAMSARVASDFHSYREASKELRNLHPTKVDAPLLHFKDEVYKNFFGPKKRGVLGLFNEDAEDRVFYFKEALKSLNKEIGPDGKPLFTDEELRTELEATDKAFNTFQSINKNLDQILPPFGRKNKNLSALQKVNFRDALFTNTMQLSRLGETTKKNESEMISSLLNQQVSADAAPLFNAKTKLEVVNERLKNSFGNYKEFLTKESKSLQKEIDDLKELGAKSTPIPSQESLVAVKNYYDSMETMFDYQVKQQELAKVKSWNALSAWFNKYRKTASEKVLAETEEADIEDNKKFAEEQEEKRKADLATLGEEEKKQRIKDNIQTLAQAGFSKGFIESLSEEDLEKEATAALEGFKAGKPPLTDEGFLYILASIDNKDSLTTLLSRPSNREKFTRLGFSIDSDFALTKQEALNQLTQIEELHRASKKRTLRPEGLGDPTMQTGIVSGRVKNVDDTRNTLDYEDQFGIKDGKANVKDILLAIINSPYASASEKELARQYLKAVPADNVIEFKENWRPISDTNTTKIRKPASSSISSMVVDLSFFGDEVQGNQAEYNATSFEATILHEVTHQLTIEALKNDPELRARLQDIAVRAEAKAKELGKSFYGLSKYSDGTFVVEELLAEAMTVPSFQQHLILTAGKETKTLWEEFIAAVVAALRKAFPNIEIKGTALEEVINLTSSIVAGKQKNISKIREKLELQINQKLGAINLKDKNALVDLFKAYQDLVVDLARQINEEELPSSVKETILQYATDKMKELETAIKAEKKESNTITFQGRTFEKGSYVALNGYSEPWKVVSLQGNALKVETKSGSSTLSMDIDKVETVEFNGKIEEVEYYIENRDEPEKVKYSSTELLKSTGKQIKDGEEFSETLDPVEARFYAFLNTLSDTDFSQPRYYGLLVQDEDSYNGFEIPKTKDTKEKLAAGTIKRGQVVIIVDQYGNPVKFNQYGMSGIEGELVAFNIETPKKILSKDSKAIAEKLGITLKEANNLKAKVAQNVSNARQSASEGKPILLKFTAVSAGTPMSSVAAEASPRAITIEEAQEIVDLINYLSGNRNQEAKDYLFNLIIPKTDKKDWKVSGGKLKQNNKDVTPTVEIILENFEYKKSFKLIGENAPFSVYSSTGQLVRTYPTYQEFLKTITNLKTALTQQSYNRFLKYEILGEFKPKPKEKGEASKIIEEELGKISPAFMQIAADAAQDEVTASQFLYEVHSQATGSVAGQIGYGEEVAKSAYGENLVKRAIAFVKGKTTQQTVTSKAGSVGVEAKKADIERLEKEKQKTLKPLIEEKEQIEKEIEEIEKDSKSSKTNSQEIESLKEKIKDLRNTDGTIPENKLNEFRSLRKQIQFLESDILHNINKAINEFISDNNLTEKDKKLIYALAEIRDNFQEVIDEFNEKRNSNYTLSEIMTFFGSSFNLQESIETETETDNKKAHEYENKLLEGNGFKANEDYTADELNDFVQKHGSKQVKFIWNLIKAVAQKLGVTTRFMLQGNSKIPVGAAGHYLNGKIENRASLFSHPESAARIIVHELVHGVTTYILKAVEQNNTKILSKLTTRQLKAVEKLNALFDELKKDKEFDDTYGTKNTHELLAELTNENFVDKLKSKNVFEKILEAIFEIFNIPFNAYNESVKILEDLISNPLEDNRYEGSLGEGYSLYSKSESTKLQQLKQKLAEVNKKIDEVTKRFNAQIAQKQAELKALENKPTPSLPSNVSSEEEGSGVGGDIRSVNDFANENESYRVIVGDGAFNDIVESGTVRTNAGNKGGESLSDKLKNRPTLFPSFSKGKASMEYAAENPNNYIIVTEDASIQPSKAGRHGKGTTMFPTDENGNHLKELSGEKVKVYKHIGEGQYVLVYANGKVVEQSLKPKEGSVEPKETKELDEDSLFGDDDLFDSSVPQQGQPEFGNELGVFSNLDTYYLIRTIDKRIHSFLINAAEKAAEGNNVFTKNIINAVNDKAFIIKAIDASKRATLKSLEDLKQEKLNSNLETSIKDSEVAKIDDKINKIEKNWPKIVSYYLQNSNIFSFADDLSFQYDENGNIITQEESVAKEKGFDNPGNTVSPIDGASKEVKALVRGLSRYENINGKLVRIRNPFNAPDLVNFPVTWNNLIKNLKGASTFDEMLQKLNALKDKNPEYDELLTALNRYKINALSGNFEAKLMVAKFYRDFINPEIPIMEVLAEVGVQNTTFKIDEATRKNVKELRKIFSDNFKTKSTKRAKTSAGDIALSPSILNMPLDTKENRIAFLQALGFEFSKETLSTPEFDLLASKNNLDRYFKGELRAILDNGEGQFTRVVKDPLSALSKGVTKGGGKNKKINDLILLESKFSTISPSLSMQNAENNTEYAISRPNMYTTVLRALNDHIKYPTFQSLVREPQFAYLDKVGAKSSILLNTIFVLDSAQNYGKRRAIDGKLITLTLENIGGLKVIGGDGAKTTSLFIGDKLVSDFNQFLKTGSKELMRAGDKSTSYGYKVSNYIQADGTLGKLPISNMDLFKGSGYGGEAMFAVMQKYLKGELHRVFLGRSGRIDNVNKISDGQERIIRKFSLFKNLLPDEVQGELYNKLDELKDLDAFGTETETALETLASEYISDSRVRQTILKFFRDEVIAKQNSLDKYGFSFSNPYWVDSDLRSLGSATLLKAYIVNEFIVHVEQTKLFNGDIVFYSQKDGDFQKRVPANGATGISPITDPWWVNNMNEDPNTNYQAKKLGVANEYSNIVKTVVFREYTPTSVYLDGWKAFFKEKGLSDEKIDRILKAYKGIKEADAQGWITLDFYRSFKLSIGDWRTEQENVFQKVSEGKELNPSEVESLHRIFSPIKAQYSGPLHHEYIHVPAFHKFSLMPLIPAAIKGTKLEALNERMLRNNIGYALMESGSKLGTIKNGSMEAFYSDNTKTMADPTTPFINENLIFMHYLKEQVQVDPEVHDHVIFGTQFRKLLFQNVYSSGKTVNHKLSELEREYSKIIEDITEFEKNSLLYDMGVEIVTKDGKVVDYVIKDEEKLAKRVLKEVKKRKLNNNIKFFFDYENGKLKNPLDASLNHQQVRTLVLSMINNRLIRQTIKGDMMIQGAVTGYEPFIKPTDADILKYGTSGLQFYHIEGGAVRKMQVKVSLTGDFKNLLYFKWNGNVIGTRERLNMALKDAEWVKQNRKAITMIGYRIPTQGLNSMEAMEVAEFLPAEAGSILIVPTEIVSKAGSDFDIDKLNVFKPSIYFNKKTQEASYVEYDPKVYDGVKAKTIAERQDVLTKLDEVRSVVEILRIKATNYPTSENLDDLLKWETTLRDLEFENNLLLADLEQIDRYKGGLYNRIIELAAERLTDLDSFEQLVTPNAVDLLKPVIMEIQKLLKTKKKPYLHTNNLTSSTQEEKYLAGIPNKNALSIAAVANTMSQLLNKVGVKIKKDSFHPMVEGNDISSMYLANGILKSEIESQMINAYVDVLNEDFISIANLSEDTAGAFFYLLHLGHDSDQLLYFFSNPVIKKYNLEIATSKSILKKEFDTKVEVDFDAAKIQEAIREGTDYTPRSLAEMKKRALNVASRQAFMNTFNTNNIISLRAPLRDLREQGITEAKRNKEIFSKEHLLNSISKDISEIPEAERLALLSYYHSVILESNKLLHLQQVNNYDTKTSVNPVYYELVDTLKEDVRASGLFSVDPEEITNKTVIKPFNQGTLVKSILNILFPVSLNENIRKSVADLYLSLRAEGRYDIDIDRLARTFVNDWMYFLALNLGELNGKSLKEGKKILFKDSLSNELTEFKTLPKWSELLANYPIIQRFRIDKYKDIYNIALDRDDSSSEYDNVLIEQMSNLVNFSDPAYSKEDQEKISKFFRNLSVLGLIQSGLNKSQISFTDITPIEMYLPMMREVVKKYKDMNKKEKDTLRYSFISLFKNNNPQIFGNRTQYQHWRFKNYESLSLDELYSDLESTIDFQEDPTTGYKERTIKNASADATIALAVDFNSAGEKLTKTSVLGQNKKYIPIDANDLTVTQERVDKIVNELNSIQKPNLNIYSKLGNKTVSNNVVIKPWAELKDVKEAIKLNQVIATRIPNTNEHFGNPFSHDPAGKAQGLIKTETIREAVEKYAEWVINSQDERAQWIRGQLRSGNLKNKPILYYKELGEPSHATALDYLINKYDWNNEPSGITLNIAGNGIYTMKGQYSQQQVDEFTYQLLKAVVNSPNLRNRIISVRTGGQTGFDEAGAKAGMRLGLPTLILAPKGWKFRNESGQDISDEIQFKARFDDVNKKTFDSSLPFVENFVSLQDGTYENLLKNLFNEGLIKPNCK